jgi:hypothetical protein
MATKWTDALNMRGSGRSIQPDSGTGAQRAGQAGYGGGSVPYAPGATQFQPQSQVPPTGRGQSQQPAPSPPPQASSGGGGGQPQQGGQQGSMTTDPQRAIAIANYLMARLQHQMKMRDQGRRG